MSTVIAISGMACRFADADSPMELWRNVLSQRRAFRRIPSQRLSLEDYLDDDHAAPDRTYSAMAAVLDGWQFDRRPFRIAGSTFRSTDLAQWLALDVAASALEDAGFADGSNLPRERTGVLVGNTLTGEFSRARALRLRWPYIRRVLTAELEQEGWARADLEGFVRSVEARFKEPFAPIDEDTLAGALSNTIAGRICNAFDLGGGGYTVDGACASSLLAVANACSGLRAGDLEIALAGGVDLSLDPFELVGFAKAGALARRSMRVYDSRPEGFWPGEGCGFLLLEPLDRLLNRGGRPYAVIRGWGISSDGAGGMTRPTLNGELRALRQAYRRAGIGIGEVDIFEGHGTGTDVGDRTELGALDAARRADGATRAAPVGSIKANIGHTKAAAGVAGLIKAALCLRERVVPPTTGCDEPHALLRGPDRVLRATNAAEAWPHAGRGRAGVSGFGFGGINCHLVLEGPAARRTRRVGREARGLTRSAQDAELILFGGPDAPTVREEVDRIRRVAEGLSLAEMGDLAAALHRDRRPLSRSAVRAALVVSSPDELATSLGELSDALSGGEPRVDIRRSIFLGLGTHRATRIGLLFPGQASPTYADGGALGRRFGFLDAMDPRMPAATEGAVDTSVAQPAIVRCELLGLELLRRLRIDATVAVGHSVGELAALHWAGALDADGVTALAAARGAEIARRGAVEGAMASLGAGPSDVKALIGDEQTVVIAAENGPRHTVISGPAADVDEIIARAARGGLSATRLRVSHAFHSPLVAAAAPGLAHALSRTAFDTPRRLVVSTVTGEPLAADADLRALLTEQLTKPVRFASALAKAVEHADVFIEVGPGAVLAGLASDVTERPVFPLDAGGRSLRPPLAAVGALYACGAPPRLDVLFAGRFTRRFDLNRPRAFLANPCEMTLADSPLGQPIDRGTVRETIEPRSDGDSGNQSAVADTDVLSIVRRLLAVRTELPEEAIDVDGRLLGELHLTSIAVGELAAEAAEALGIRVPAPPTELADATVADLASALEASRAGGGALDSAIPEGVAAWFRTFASEWVPRPAPRAEPTTHRWEIIAPVEHPLLAEITKVFAGDRGERAVLVCLPSERHEAHALLLLEGAQEVLRRRARRCAFLHTGGGAAGFAKSFRLEHPEVDVAVIDMELEPALLQAVRREAESAHDFVEARYEHDGERRVPVLRRSTAAVTTAVLGPHDVVLVSGGGKGIGCECALNIARASGAKVALLGRTDPREDDQLRENLARFDDAGVCHRYLIADVTDRQSLDSAVKRAVRELGEVTAILHAAGTNRPARVQDLDADELTRTLAPKVAGLRHLLGAVDAERLRLLITFGSIIGRIGLRGEAHYALANEWLGCSLIEARDRLPRCRCLNIEWTVWTGVGMGERLGTITALTQAGVTPLPLDEGVRIMEQLSRSEAPSGSIVVAGRFGLPPTIELESRELPLLRFLERPLMHYPGIELVVEAKLSHGSDPYLADHVIDGSALLPAAIGLEAMASVACALSRSAGRPVLEDARFDRPVTVSPDRDRAIRLAGIVGPDGTVRVVLRSDETGFQADHFALTCRFASHTPIPDGVEMRVGSGNGAFDARISSPTLELDPASEFYGGLLFQGPRFQRVLAYRELRAHSCVAEVSAHPDEWFGAFLPQALVLGDPGAHDAIIHAIQPCLPYARLVPVGLERLTVDQPPVGRLTVEAHERKRDGKIFVYDVTVRDATGGRCETWEGLTLQRIGDTPRRELWPPALLVPFLERRLEEEIGGRTVRIALQQNGSRRQASDLAIAELLGRASTVRRRTDGRPEVATGLTVSTTHFDKYTLALAGDAPLGCDVEAAIARPERRWADLLGAPRLELASALAGATDQPLSVGATRVWAAVECLKKAGLPLSQPLVLRSTAPDGWIVLRGGEAVIATFVAQLSTVESPVAIALLVGSPTK